MKIYLKQYLKHLGFILTIFLVAFVAESSGPETVWDWVGQITVMCLAAGATLIIGTIIKRYYLIGLAISAGVWYLWC